MLTFDRDLFLKINTALFNFFFFNFYYFFFLWKGKDKIKRLALVSDYNDGGLKMPHVESTIKTQKIMCFKKFSENYYSPWKLILSQHLKNYGDKFLLHCNYDLTDLPKYLPKFYRECLEAWATLTEKQPTSRDHVIEQILWNIKHIRIDDKPQFCKKSFMAGISKIKDIFLTNVKLKPWNFFQKKALI